MGLEGMEWEEKVRFRKKNIEEEEMDVIEIVSTRGKNEDVKREIKWNGRNRCMGGKGMEGD